MNKMVVNITDCIWDGSHDNLEPFIAFIAARLGVSEEEACSVLGKAMLLGEPFDLPCKEGETVEDLCQAIAALGAFLSISVPGLVESEGP